MSKDNNDKKTENLGKIRRVVKRLADTQDGKEFINYLMRLCGFGKSSLVINPTTLEINTVSSVYNEARETIYHEIRNLIDDKKVLAEIEYMQVKEENDET